MPLSFKVSTLLEEGKSRTKFSCTGDGMVLLPFEVVTDVVPSSLPLLSEPVRSMVLAPSSKFLPCERGFLLGGGDIDRFLVLLGFSGTTSILGLFLVTNASIARNTQSHTKRIGLSLDARNMTKIKVNLKTQGSPRKALQ